MPALSTARGNRLKAVGVTDFSGGLSLAPPQELAPNEAAFARDVVFSSRGGFGTRPGFRPFSGSNFSALGDIIQVLTHTHSRSDGVQQLFGMEYTTGANIKWSSGGQWFDTGFSGGTTLVGLETATRIPTGVNGAQYLDKSYFVKAIGGSVMWDGYTSTALGFSFDPDIAAPSGLNLPASYLIANKGDFMFIAVTSETDGLHRDRIRWSHPGLPTSWREEDYIDIPRGNITAIVPFRDFLAVFTDDQIYGLYGNSTETFQLQEISSSSGTPYRWCVAASPSTLYWWDWDQGVMAMAGGAPKSIFTKIKPFFDRSGFDADPFAETSFSVPPNLLWGEGKLYMNTPLNPHTHPQELGNLFVFDPQVGAAGAWTTYSGILVTANSYTHGCAVFPRQFLSDLVVFGDSYGPTIVNDQAQELDRNYTYDVLDKRPPNALLRTAPFSGDTNVTKKRWRRPRVAIRSGSARQKIKFAYLRDYFEGAATNYNEVQLDFSGKVADGSLFWSEPAIDDNFASEDTLTWTGWSGTVHVVSNALNLDVAAAGATQTLTTVASWDFDEVAAGAQLTQQPSGTATGSVLLFNGNENVRFRTTGGTTTCSWRNAAAVVTTLGSFAHGASTDWVRFRVDEDDVLYYEHSPDGVTWTTAFSLAYPLTTRSLKMQFEATVPAAGSQTHIWDNAFFGGVGSTEWDSSDWAGLVADPDQELPDNWIAFETLPSAGAGNAFQMEFASVFTNGVAISDETTNRSWGIDSIVLPYREKGVR